MEEIWKPIPNYEGLYEVSNLGNVKSLKFNKERILSFDVDVHGYLNVGLYKHGVKKTKKSHHLVAEAFLNHKPDGTHKLVVDHINDIKTDNKVENLQIVTQRENSHKTQGNYSSKYKGVCWNKTINKWVSHIYLNGKLKCLGRFKSELEASVAYQNKLKEILC